MASLIYLDTHVVVWLYAGQIERLPATAQDLINDNDLRISPMVLVEMQYLHEIGRFTEQAEPALDALRRSLGIAVCEQPFLEVSRRALDQNWTRDPFDRLIVSQASLREARLLTKDRQIHQHYSGAIWSEDPPSEAGS